MMMDSWKSVVESETEEKYEDDEGELNVGMKSLTVRAAVLTASPMQLRARHEYVPRDLSGDGMMKMLKMTIKMMMVMMVMMMMVKMIRMMKKMMEMLEMLIVMLTNLLPLS